MKKTAVILGLVLTGVLAYSPVFASSVYVNAHSLYRFDNNYTDSAQSPHGDLTPLNSPNFVSGPVLYRGGIEFNGTSQYTTSTSGGFIPLSGGGVLVNGGNVWLHADVKFKSTSGTQTIWSNKNNLNGGEGSILRYKSGALKYGCNGTTNPDSCVIMSYTWNPGTASWHTIDIGTTYVSGFNVDYTMYIDGTAVSTAFPAQGILTADDEQACFGAECNSNGTGFPGLVGNYFDGYLADVFYAPQSADTSKITDIYNSGLFKDITTFSTFSPSLVFPSNGSSLPDFNDWVVTINNPATSTFPVGVIYNTTTSTTDGVNLHQDTNNSFNSDIATYANISKATDLYNFSNTTWYATPYLYDPINAVVVLGSQVSFTINNSVNTTSNSDIHISYPTSATVNKFNGISYIYHIDHTIYPYNVVAYSLTTDPSNWGSQQNSAARLSSPIDLNTGALPVGIDLQLNVPYYLTVGLWGTSSSTETDFISDNSNTMLNSEKISFTLTTSTLTNIPLTPQNIGGTTRPKIPFTNSCVSDLFNPSTWFCPFEDIFFGFVKTVDYAFVGDPQNPTDVGYLGFVDNLFQHVFPLNIINKFNDDIQIATNATSTTSHLTNYTATTSTGIFLTATVDTMLSASSTAKLTQIGFEYKTFLDYIMWLITGVLMLFETIHLIRKSHDSAASSAKA